MNTTPVFSLVRLADPGAELAVLSFTGGEAIGQPYRYDLLLEGTPDAASLKGTPATFRIRPALLSANPGTAPAPDSMPPSGTASDVDSAADLIGAADVNAAINMDGVANMDASFRMDAASIPDVLVHGILTDAKPEGMNIRVTLEPRIAAAHLEEAGQVYLHLDAPRILAAHLEGIDTIPGGSLEESLDFRFAPAVEAQPWPPLEAVAQYRESSLDFAYHVAQDAGLHDFFVQTPDRETWVLARDFSDHPVAQPESLALASPVVPPESAAPEPALPESPAVPTSGFHLTAFDSPTPWAAQPGDALARIHSEGTAPLVDPFRGESTCPTLHAGQRFTPACDLNPDGKDVLVIEIRHEGSVTPGHAPTYHNSFTAIGPAQTPVAPAPFAPGGTGAPPARPLPSLVSATSPNAPAPTPIPPGTGSTATHGMGTSAGLGVASQAAGFAVGATGLSGSATPVPGGMPTPVPGMDAAPVRTPADAAPSPAPDASVASPGSAPSPSHAQTGTRAAPFDASGSAPVSSTPGNVPHASGDAPAPISGGTPGSPAPTGDMAGYGIPKPPHTASAATPPAPDSPAPAAGTGLPPRDSVSPATQPPASEHPSARSDDAPADAGDAPVDSGSSGGSTPASPPVDPVAGDSPKPPSSGTQPESSTPKDASPVSNAEGNAHPDEAPDDTKAAAQATPADPDADAPPSDGDAGTDAPPPGADGKAAPPSQPPGPDAPATPPSSPGDTDQPATPESTDAAHSDGEPHDGDGDTGMDDEPDAWPPADHPGAALSPLMDNLACTLPPPEEWDWPLHPEDPPLPPQDAPPFPAPADPEGEPEPVDPVPGSGVEVKPGDDIASIAVPRGLAPDTVWNDPENAALRERRGSPHALLPGDRVHVRPLQTKDESGGSGACYTFRLRGVPEMLNLRFLDPHGAPRADEPYRLLLDGIETEGTLDADGCLHATIPPGAKSGTLHLSGIGRLYPLALGHLDPVQSVKGMQARLLNLGYDCGSADGIYGSRTRAAMQAFQASNGLPAKEMPDAAMQETLVRLYGI